MTHITSETHRGATQVAEIASMRDGMGSACQVSSVRTVFIALALLLPACVDAPITEAHIAPNGQLRAHLEQSSFSAQPRLAMGQAVQVAAVLAAQPEGALEDAAEFPASAGAVTLVMPTVHCNSSPT